MCFINALHGKHLVVGQGISSPTCGPPPWSPRSPAGSWTGQSTRSPSPTASAAAHTQTAATSKILLRRTWASSAASPASRPPPRTAAPLRSTLAAVGLALTDQAGVRLARCFGVSVSCSTVLQLLTNDLPRRAEPAVPATWNGEPLADAKSVKQDIHYRIHRCYSRGLAAVGQREPLGDTCRLSSSAPEPRTTKPR
jgi:hypothetical protein